MHRGRSYIGAGILLLLLFFQTTSATGTDYNLDIRLHTFEQPHWTWAASSQSVFEYYGKDFSQCTVATLGLYGNDCCAFANACNAEIAPNYIEDVLSNENVFAYQIYGRISWPNCVYELNNGRPFIMEFDYWDEDTMEPFRSSYVVARGYDPSSYSLVYLDPKYSYMKDSYDFLTGYNYVYEQGIYAVLDWGDTLKIYNNPKPDCETGDASWTTNTAHISGTVNPNDRATTVTFRLSPSPSDQGNNFTYYNESPPASASGPYDIPFYNDWTLLSPGTTYYYQIKAVSDGGVCLSTPGSFTTSTPPPPQSLGLQVFVSGQDTVTNVYPASPVVNTSSSLNVTYPYNTWVRLLATPASGYGFPGWSYADMGFACSGTGRCDVLMNADKSVAATFAPLRTLTVTKSGSGTGTVISAAPASPMINCGSVCSNTYIADDGLYVNSVTLSAIPDPGKSFTGWSGDCGGTGLCTVWLDANRSVSASFSAANPVKVGSLYYSTIQTAYNSAATGNEIKLLATDFGENPVFNRPIEVRIQGGYSENFAYKIGGTVIRGVLTISNGSVIVDGLQIGG